MIYMKDIKRNSIKNWMQDTYGKNIFKIFEIEQKHMPSKQILIRTVPNLLNHPLYLWIFPCYNNMGTRQNGKVCVRSLENNIFHHVSSTKLMYDKLELEINKLLNKITKIARKAVLIK